jgi:hypothetical protein
MYARLLIPAGTTKRILVLECFVAEVGQLNIVWVLQSKTEEQIVEKRLIKTGLVNDERYGKVLFNAL